MGSASAIQPAPVALLERGLGDGGDGDGCINRLIAVECGGVTTLRRPMQRTSVFLPIDSIFHSRKVAVQMFSR